MKNVFNLSDSEEIIDRINRLNPQTKPLWGKMSVAQMLAHCNVGYEMIFEDKHKKPNPLLRLLLKAFVKNKVVNEAPFPRNSLTSPQFKVTDNKNFEEEKTRLIAYITKTQSLGAPYFDQRDYPSFGRLSVPEWNNMLYKHLDHHLNQFGV